MSPPSSKLSPAVARLYLLLGAVLWSSGGYFIKEIDAGALSITFFRCLFAAGWLLPLVPRTGRLAGRRFPRLPDIVASVVLFALLLGLYVGSTKATTAANAIFLQYTAPIYVILFSPLILQERLDRRDAPPLAICLTGIAILFLGNQGSGDLDGLLMGLGSGFFYGLFLIWLRRVRYADPIAVTFINCVGVALILAPVPSVYDVGSTDILLLILMGLVQFALPYVFFTWGLHRVSSGEASLIALIEPVLNPIWVLILLAEEPSTATIIGGAVIIGGLAVRYFALRAPAARALEEEAEELAEPT